MAYIDTNLTYSQQVCDLAVGGLMGMGGMLYTICRLLLITLAFYTVYRITKIFIKNKSQEVCNKEIKSIRRKCA